MNQMNNLMKGFAPERINIRTQPWLAEKIIKHFSPQFKITDSFLDPCAGDNAFFDALPENKDWCEISRGKDYFKSDLKVDWIITNFPWSGKEFRPLVNKAYADATNVVHLIRLENILGRVTAFKDMKLFNHLLKEVIIVPWKNAFFDKPVEGFTLCAIHSQRSYMGDVRFTNWL